MKTVWSQPYSHTIVIVSLVKRWCIIVKLTLTLLDLVHNLLLRCSHFIHSHALPISKPLCRENSITQPHTTKAASYERSYEF